MVMCNVIAMAQVNYPNKKLIEEGEFSKAYEKIKNALSDKPQCLDHYAAFMLYSDPRSPYFDNEQAYQELVACKKSKEDATGRTFNKIVDNGLLDSRFKPHFDHMCDIGLQKAKSSYTIESFNHFLTFYSEYATEEQKAQAQAGISHLVFLDAKDMNTIDAYNSFISTYPYANDRKEAQRLRDHMIAEQEAARIQDSIQKAVALRKLKKRVADMDEIPIVRVLYKGHYYYLADIDDTARLYRTEVTRDSCFLVVSKHEYRIYVYEAIGGDTALVAHFPICYGRNPEAKVRVGDMRTPESTMEAPIKISNIGASTYSPYIGEGGGISYPYGPWFHNLQTPNGKNLGIGIHGSAGSLRHSIPGRGSHGCIRMRNEDVSLLHDHYSFVGQKVIIKSINTKKYPFEIRAEEALGDQYIEPTLGHPIVKMVNKGNKKK